MRFKFTRELLNLVLIAVRLFGSKINLMAQSDKAQAFIIWRVVILRCQLSFIADLL